MDLAKVDPEELAISEQNERESPDGAEELAGLRDSITERGVVQPPIARETGDGMAVVVGQRRTLAARGVLDSIPVVVADWDDADALAASITENIDAFREGVADNERGMAVARLIDEWGCQQREVADRLGVDPTSVSNWLEAARPEWEGTAIEPEWKRQKSELSGSTKDSVSSSADENSPIPDGVEDLSSQVGGDTLRTIRGATGGGEEGEEMAHKVAKGDLSRSDVREIARDVRAQNQEADTNDRRGSINVSVNVTGDLATDLAERADSEGVPEEDIVRKAIRAYLSGGN